jgi:hypothetical protein
MQVSNESEVEDIRKTAEEVAGKWVNPLSGGTKRPMASSTVLSRAARPAY